MRRIGDFCICVIVMMLATLCFCSAKQKDESGFTTQEYELVWADEFNGKDYSQPDSTYWSHAESNSSMWAKWICDDNDLVYMKNGKLICLAKPNKKDKTHTSMRTGAIWTKNKFNFQYGKVEVKMRTNNDLGNFPAVWMKNLSGSYAEIDIVEVFGNRKESQHCIHSQYTQNTKGHKEKNRNSFSCDITKWHIYGLEWTEDMIRWTVDGSIVATYNKPTNKEILAKDGWNFDTPFYLILNQSVGDGTYDWAVPNFNKTYKTEFDWIRVYQEAKDAK